MDPHDRELLEQIYGLNWAALGSQRQAFAGLAELVSEDLEMKLSPEIGARVIKGLDELREFAEALEQDFQDCRYEAEQIEECGDRRAVVTGRIDARGRSSNLPLSGEFGHVWTLEEGEATRMESFRDKAEARKAGGLE